jgi:hypothetical protein
MRKANSLIIGSNDLDLQANDRFFSSGSNKSRFIVKCLIGVSIAFAFAGCGSSSDDDAPPIYTAKCFDDKLELIEQTQAEAGSSVKLYDICGAGAWYLAGQSDRVTAHAFSGAINFYAVPDVVEITDQAGLNAIREVMSGKYMLTKDITLVTGENGVDSVEGWLPINNAISSFTGVFNGGGHTIRGLWIDRPATDYIGLFGRVGSKAIIKNLSVVIDNDKGGINGAQYVGAIAGYLQTPFPANVYGITLSDLNSTGDINGTSSVGGIAGYAFRVSIERASFSGKIVGRTFVNSNGSGGIAGTLSGGVITNSYSTGDINATYSVGGIAGHSSVGSEIANSYSTANITASATNGRAGGIAGTSDGSDIVNCYARGDVTSTVGDYVGGVVGNLNGGVIKNSYSTGSLIGKAYVGGIAGQEGASSFITYSAAINPSVTGINDSYVSRISGVVQHVAYNVGNFALRSTIITPSSIVTADALKDDAEFKVKETYSKTVELGGLGWGFGDDDENPWKIDRNKNDGYPYLYWQK